MTQTMPKTIADIGETGRTVVVGVVNVTPDSFSDGGIFDGPADAVAHGEKLRDLGADIVDVGGESTRPGAERIDVGEELARVIPVIAGLVAAGVAVSIDTMRAEVARAAVAEGARLVNDVSGGLADEAMLSTVAELDVPIVLMHWRAHSAQMDEFTHYDDVVAEVVRHLSSRCDAALAAGVDPEQVILDPGLGFAKLAAHNWALLHDLDALKALGRPLLLGASRKRFLGAVLASPDGVPRTVEAREAATAAVSAIAAFQGVWGVRVHEVSGTLDAVKVARAWREGADW